MDLSEKVYFVAGIGLTMALVSMIVNLFSVNSYPGQKIPLLKMISIVSLVGFWLGTFIYILTPFIVPYFNR